jgi:hypothetical protein
MKIVLDTNVFISGIFFRGPPSQILQALAERLKTKRYRAKLLTAIFEADFQIKTSNHL